MSLLEEAEGMICYLKAQKLPITSSVRTRLTSSGIRHLENALNKVTTNLNLMLNLVKMYIDFDRTAFLKCEKQQNFSFSFFKKAETLLSKMSVLMERPNISSACSKFEYLSVLAQFEFLQFLKEEDNFSFKQKAMSFILSSFQALSREPDTCHNLLEFEKARKIVLDSPVSSTNLVIVVKEFLQHNFNQQKFNEHIEDSLSHLHFIRWQCEALETFFKKAERKLLPTECIAFHLSLLEYLIRLHKNSKTRLYHKFALQANLLYLCDPKQLKNNSAYRKTLKYLLDIRHPTISQKIVEFLQQDIKKWSFPSSPPLEHIPGINSISPREKELSYSNKAEEYEIDSLVEEAQVKKTSALKSNIFFESYKAVHKPTNEHVVLVKIRNVGGFDRESIKRRQKWCQKYSEVMDPLLNIVWHDNNEQRIDFILPFHTYSLRFLIEKNVVTKKVLISVLKYVLRALETIHNSTSFESGHGNITLKDIFIVHSEKRGWVVKLSNASHVFLFQSKASFSTLDNLDKSFSSREQAFCAKMKRTDVEQFVALANRYVPECKFVVPHENDSSKLASRILRENSKMKKVDEEKVLNEFMNEITKKRSQLTSSSEKVSFILSRRSSEERNNTY